MADEQCRPCRESKKLLATIEEQIKQLKDQTGVSDVSTQKNILLGRIATMQGTIYGPDDAARIGYLDAVVPPGDVVAKAMEEATRLGGLSKMAYSATKARMRGKTIEHIIATLESDMASMLPSG